MGNKILALIDDKYKDFSKTNKIISDYIKYNYTDVSFLSIKELSEKTGVSTASISRYVNALGFKGYQEFQKEMQNILKVEIEPSTEVKNAILVEYENSILSDLIRLNIKNLEDLCSDELCGELDKAIEMIRWDRKVYIIGLRSTYTVAYHLYYMLSKYKPNVELIELGVDNIYDKLTFINKDDMLISISFSKYSENTLRITEFFHNNGNEIIAITDSAFSPIAQIADVSLIIQNRHDTFSFVSVMTLINALTVSVGKKYKDKSLERIKYKEEVLKNNDIHVIKG